MSVYASYCEGTPESTWNFGDGTTSSGSQATHTYAAAGTYSWKVTVTVGDTSEVSSGTISVTARASTVNGVSAASYDGSSLSSEVIVATFGSGLAATTEIAPTIPLPTTLAGITVKVKDSAGTERLAPLFFVSPGQINHLMPAGTAAGTATVTVTAGNVAVATGTFQIANVSPGLFSANSSGQGVVSGYVLRIRADSSQSIEPISQYDAAQSKFIAVSVDLGPATDQVILVLFGTGFRSRSALSAVSLSLGGENAPVLFAGPQGDFVGLDQLNIQMPRGLGGRGEIDCVLTVDGRKTNTTRISIK